MPGKVHHLFAWGYNQTNLDRVSPKAPKPALNLDGISKAMPCHVTPTSDHATGERGFWQSRVDSHGEEGHLCIAAKDTSGYFLGPVPYMAMEAMKLLRPVDAK